MQDRAGSDDEPNWLLLLLYSGFVGLLVAAAIATVAAVMDWRDPLPPEASLDHAHMHAFPYGFMPGDVIPQPATSVAELNASIAAKHRLRVRGALGWASTFALIGLGGIVTLYAGTLVARRFR